ncbi:hypothetical protein V8C35DRAFT_316755 [Trichoderma chlorosporum]
MHHLHPRYSSASSKRLLQQPTLAMPPFKIPSRPYYISKKFQWERNNAPDLRDPDILWNDYWRRFNTIQLPILKEEDFLKRAVAIAKVAKNREEFETLFEKRNIQQRERLMDFMLTAGLKTMFHEEIFPCEEAHHVAFNICQTGCFVYFMKLLQGSVLGWEADMASDDLNEDIDGISDQATHNSTEESRDVCDNNPYNKDLYGTQRYFDEDLTYETDIERQVREEQEANSTFYIGTVWFTPVPATADASKQSAALPEAQNTPKKRVRFDDDDTTTEPATDDMSKQSAAPLAEAQDRPRKRVRLSEGDATIPTDDTPKQSAASQTEAQNASKKRARSDDDDTTGEPKRRKLESPASPPTSHDLSSLSSHNAPIEDLPREKSSIPTTQITDGNLVGDEMKTSVDENSPVREYRKLQKPNQHTPASHEPPTQPVTDGRVLKKKSKYRRKKGHQQNCSPNTLNTRSTRRNSLSLFMELDEMCRPRLVNKG